MRPSCFFALLSLCIPVWGRSPLPDTSIEDILGGRENQEIIESAKTVEVYRVFFDWGSVPKSATGRVSGFPCLPQPVRFSRIDVERVVASLLRQSTYRVNTMCDFMPGVLFRFVSDQTTFDFVVCFSCSDMAMYRDGVFVHRTTTYAQGMIGFSGSSWREFAALAKRAFPQDRAIQSLGAKKEK